MCVKHQGSRQNVAQVTPVPKKFDGDRTFPTVHAVILAQEEPGNGRGTVIHATEHHQGLQETRDHISLVELPRGIETIRCAI